MAEETLEQRLAKLYAKRDFVDRFNEDDVKTLIDAIRDAREHGGTASVDITPLSGGGGYTITITDSEGTEHTATVKDGGDAYSVYESTVPDGQTPMSKAEWLASLKGDTGNDGADGHNPCLGRFNVLPTLSPNPFADARNGDYIYFDTTDSQTSDPVTYIYHFDGTNWDAQGTVVDVSNLTFNSGESVPGTSIDGTGLANPLPNALAKAADVLQLKAKLRGVTASEVKVQLVESGEGQNVYDGFINGSTGKYSSSIYNKFIVIPLNGAKSVRWLAKENTSNSSYLGWAFGIFEGEIDSTLSTFTALSKGVYSNNPLNNQAVEYIQDAPDNVTHVAITIWFYQSGGGSSVTMDNFYCYLQSGKSVAEMNPQVTNNLVDGGANDALSAEQGRILNLKGFNKSEVDLTTLYSFCYYMNNETLKYGTDTSYKHTSLIVDAGDIVEFSADAEHSYNVFLLTEDRLGSGYDIKIVEGTSPIYVGASDKVYFEIPNGCKAIAYNQGNNIHNPSSINIYKKKADNIDTFERTIPQSEIFSIYKHTINTNFFIAFSGVDSSNTLNAIRLNGGCEYVIMATATSAYKMSVLDELNSETTLLHRNIPVGDTVTYYKAENDCYLVYSGSTDIVTVIEKRMSDSSFNDLLLDRLIEISNFEQIDYSALLKSGGIYISTNSNSGIYTASKSYKHILLHVNESDVFRIKKGTNDYSYYAWITDDTLVSGALPNYVEGTCLVKETDEDYLIVAPATAKFLYVFVSYTTETYLSYIAKLAPSSNALTDDMQNRRDYNIAQATSVGLSKLNIQVDENGWELPATLQQLNAQKKAEQLCNIKWKPKYNVPSKISPYYYDANVEQTSIPYSSNNDEGTKKVGVNLSIHTFMTAVNNPYSLLYTECINNETRFANPTKASAWGKDYTKSSNGYAYYGTVCCGLTSSVENSPIVWNNTEINNYLKTNGLYIQICPIGTVDFNLLQIGDVADNTTHSFLVYGLHRDANGNVDKVMIAESSSAIGRGKCKISTYNTREAFVNRVNESRNPFTLFRYVKLWNNTDYEPSEFVPLTDRGETATEVTRNDAICTFAGDKATFRSGDLVVINYNINGTQPHDWTKIKVYKDDVLLGDGEYTLAEAEATLEDFYTKNGEDTSLNGFNVISQHNHALVLGNELAEGMYKACMSDGINDSDFTYWEVIPNTITVVEQDYDSYKVNVSGGFLEAIYVGNAYYLPTYDEQATNEFIIHPIALMQAWGLSYDGIDVRVKLKGKYGSVMTDGATVIEGDAPEPEPEPDDDTNP